MNRQYLGDAMDWWKGALLGWLQSNQFMRDVVVVPCFTDEHSWTSKDFALYCKLLGTDRDHIRDESDVHEFSDTFFDPDTGVKTSGSADSKYVSPERLHAVFRRNPNCVAAIYQHVSRQKTRSRISRVVEILQQSVPKACFCSSESSGVAMLFGSLHCGRIESIADGLNSLYGNKARDRVGMWKCGA